MLSGCGKGNTSDVFSVTDEQADKYKEEITTVLSADSWGYNPDMIAFSQAVMPNKDDSIYAMLDTFTSEGSVTAKPYAGKTVVQATVPLQHINGDNMGTAYFFFDKDKDICNYYVYNDKYYVLKSKNPFELNDVLVNYENTDKFASFEESKPKLDISSAYAVNNGIVATIEDNNTTVFYDGKDDFKVSAMSDFSGRGLIPMDVTLGDDFGTILLGEKVEVQQTEDENEESDIISEPPAKSVSLAIVKSDGTLTGIEVPTTVSSFTSLTQVGDRLFFARDKSVDEFVYENKNLTKVKTYMFDHYISKIYTADIDGNGTVEFIMSDGTNIYIYEKKSTFDLVWRSNSYLSSINGNIYIGDLNEDGVKELYVTDSLGVTARYVLTEQGMRINGGGIMSGGADKYIIADFDCDGKDDYITTNENGKNLKLYLAK